MMSLRTAYRQLWLLFIVVAVLAGVSAPALAISLEEEVELGRKIDAQILKEYPLITDQKALNEINEYGSKLIKNVRRPEIEYHFRILKDDELNAFSTPGGYVYFSEHLWNVLRKDERIGVLAHEIVHTDRRHALDAISKQQRRQLWLTLLLTVVGANSTWGDIAGLAESLYSLKYSRGDEQQADEIGVELAAQAGYNPAGLLLAMRKIGRFQSEAGGQPPKVFSSHPPTKERLAYLEQLLTKMNVPIPPENIQDTARSDMIGTVTSVERNTVQFTSSKPQAVGDIVWLMAGGWDYYYEKRTPVPIARGVVRSVGNQIAAEFWPVSESKVKEIKPGIGVYAPPTPSLESGAGKLSYISRDSKALGKLQANSKFNKLDRLLGRQVVWNKDYSKLVTDNVGYLVVTNPEHETGYVAVTRSKYMYAPIAADAVLVRLNDKDQDRWVGPIVSIGRGGQTIEIMPNRTLEPDKTYDVVYPAWDDEISYEKRIVGTAIPKSTSGKIVLQMNGYVPGWNIDSIQNGFDVYEQPGQK